MVINHLPEEEPDAREVIELIRAEGRKGVSIPGDLRNERFCAQLVERAVRELGGLDILVNNAARQQTRPAIADISSEDFDATLKTNVYAPFWLTKAAVTRMQAGGVIVNTSSEQAGDPSDRTDWIVLVDKAPHGVSLSYDEDEALLLAFTGGGHARLTEIDWRPGLAQFRAELDGEPFTAEVKRVADGFDIRHRAARARVRVMTPRAAEFFARLPEKQAADTSKLIQSPMPGLVVSVPVSVGQAVKTGETVAIIEAMKM